jgi:hypothetical protein
MQELPTQCNVLGVVRKIMQADDVLFLQRGVDVLIPFVDVRYEGYDLITQLSRQSQIGDAARESGNDTAQFWVEGMFWIGELALGRYKSLST